MAVIIPSLAWGTEPAGKPAFDCGKIESGSIEQLICQDQELAQLDRKLAEVYAAAQGKAADGQSPRLRTEQRGWIKGRNDCWKSADQRSCVAELYRLRIAELQAQYRLIKPSGPFTYLCDEKKDRPVVVHYFQTEPPTAWAEFGDSSALLYRQPSGSGAKYAGSDVLLWEHQGEATIVWGYGAPEMRCSVAPSETQSE